MVPKCGLLQRLCCDSGDLEKLSIELHDIPGGEEAFELCAKFCYGIKINLSAYNFVPAFCGAKFLGMTESVDKGNFVPKLEAFLNSCILEGWKDSIVTLETTVKLPDWSENLGIIRRCIDSIVEKILTPPPKVGYFFPCLLKLKLHVCILLVINTNVSMNAGDMVLHLYQTWLQQKAPSFCPQRLVDRGYIRP